MTMDDWLDSRLAEDRYLPDDGFTARVMQQVTPAAALGERRRLALMAPFVLLASVIFGLESLVALLGEKSELFSLGTRINPVLHSPERIGSYLGTLSSLGHLFSQPVVWFWCVGLGLASTFISTPAFRRWI